MFKKILVANRGEIAMRIIRACRELNIATAAIYSEADSTGIYVKKADEAYMVGPGPVKGFLDGQQIVSLAQRIGADAIHPGYGFLSENSQFAQLCHTSGITFIGPSPQAIDLMGSKVKARDLAKRVGIPIVPGTEGGITAVKDALSFAKDTGYPVMIKASAGGGDAASGWCGRIPNFVRTWQSRHAKPRLPSATEASSSKSISSDRITSNFRSWPTGTATSSTWASAIARFSAGIKSSSRLRHL